MASQKKDLEMICESCKKPFVPSTLLRHIGKSESCLSFYGPRFIQMKKEKGREKVNRYRLKNSTATPSQLSKRRNSYATDPDKKEKRKQYYQKHKQMIKQQNETERTEMLSLIAKRNNEKISKQDSVASNILYKSLEKIEDLEKVFEKEVVLCDHCRDEFTPNAILVHIGKSKNCKSYYGEAYDKIKFSKGKILENCILAKKRERYKTDSELREKKKESSKTSYQKLKARLCILISLIRPKQEAK